MIRYSSLKRCFTKGDYVHYSPSDAVTVRAPHGDDLRAEHCPWHCGSGRVLSDSPGVHVVHFRLVWRHRQTSHLRSRSEVLALARQRWVLV